MQKAEVVLGIIRERGRKGLPLERLYRCLFNPELYLLAYGRIYRNAGAMTPGSTMETADRMRLEKIQAIIAALRGERFRWTPTRRVYIEKKGSAKKRPLGVTSWTDKLLQEVIRLLLEAYYEPQFSGHSHGFRHGRGCHTALQSISPGWRGTTWFIEGDVTDCFGSLDHSIMKSILAEKIHDGRFLRLMDGLFRAGYLEEWRYHSTLSGCPQGGVISPVLCNIYLDRLDKHIESNLLPAYNRGKQRQFNRAYMRLRYTYRRQEKAGNRDMARMLWQQMQRLPSRDPADSGFRRLHYCRYADDWLLGFTGPKLEAEEIKANIGEFLRNELKLELSPSKTLITHGRTSAAHFLGYEIIVHQSDTKHSQRGWRSINAQIGLKVPRGVAQSKAKPYLRHGKPIHRTERMTDSDFSIIAQYQAEYRGVVNYYQLAINRHQFEWLKYVMQCSLTKTLAHKYRISVPEVYRRYRAVLATDHGPRQGLQVVIERGDDRKPLVAQWGGISLARRTVVKALDDQPPKVWNNQRSELVQRLLAETCELCGSGRNIEVHHVRHLKDLQPKGRAPKPEWAERMASRRRKTLVVCRRCHHAIHNGQPTGQHTRNTTLESRVRS